MMELNVGLFFKRCPKRHSHSSFYLQGVIFQKQLKRLPDACHQDLSK